MHTKSKHLKYLLFIPLCFVALSVQSQSYIIDQMVAIVGNKSIKQSDIEGMYLQYRMQGAPMRDDMKCSIFEELLTQKLLASQAEVDSLTVDPSKVESTLSRRWVQMVGQAGDEQELEKYFKKSIFDIKDDLRKALYEQELSNNMQEEILKDIKVTPSEVRAYYNKLSKDSIPLINGQAEIAQIVVYPPYSDEVISEIRQKLLDLRKRIINGESFRTLAVLYSEEPAASRTGGEMGFHGKGGDGRGNSFDPEFVRAEWALKNKGDVSRIVETEFGYHIIQLIEKRGDQINSRHIIMTPKPDQETSVKSIARLDSIATIIKDEKIDWNTAALYYSQDEKTRLNGGLLVNPADYSTLFEMNQLEKVDYEVIKNLKPDEISAPFQSVDDKHKPVFKIVKIKSLSDPHRANLKDDYSFLQQITENSKKMTVINKWVNEKIETSYIYIDERLERCGFHNTNWVK
ncbi:MAG: peptidylprolyl isomerase [Bacteroidales bacterium]|jgi:peptidyl-prolyl cis-trans isomerase SurA|nr:peptidylprolyl isomerase [Bacteroidales bacterium]